MLSVILTRTLNLLFCGSLKVLTLVLQNTALAIYMYLKMVQFGGTPHSGYLMPVTTLRVNLMLLSLILRMEKSKRVYLLGAGGPQSQKVLKSQQMKIHLKVNPACI